MASPHVLLCSNTNTEEQVKYSQQQKSWHISTYLGIKFLFHIGPIGCSQNIVEHYENIALEIKGQIRAVTDFYQMRNVFFFPFVYFHTKWGQFPFQQFNYILDFAMVN